MWYRRLGDTYRKLHVDKYAQAKAFPISNTINVTQTGNLSPTSKQPNSHPFLWHANGQMPDTIRWVWNPRTGEMRVGTPVFHTEQIKKGEVFDSFVRGFYFPAKNTISIRPFFHPAGPYDEWDQTHANLNDRIMSKLIPMLQKTFPNAKVEAGVDNQWLRSNIDKTRNW